MKPTSKVLAFSGGVGGAKLALGLSQVLDAQALTIVANTADDFEHLGLTISPDLDTVMYTLAGINNQQQGWGLANESWSCMQAMERLQGDTWFRLGDQDIATHLLRSQWLREGKSHTDITLDLCTRLGIKHRLLPMCNEPVRTIVHSDIGDLPFQEYFVKRQCAPKVSGFHFNGIEQAQLSPELNNALQTMRALIICPSNPFVSIAPILAIPEMKNALLQRNVPRVVVSPIVNGMAIKGPAAKMMQELDMPSTALAVAGYYQELGTHFVLDNRDEQYQKAIVALGYQVIMTNTIMTTLNDRIQLARDIITALPD